MKHHAGIPIIDLSSWQSLEGSALQKFVHNMGNACHVNGFFYVQGHNLSSEFIDAYLKQIRLFFTLPESEKQKIDKTNSPHFRGWEKLGSELTNNILDYREQLDLGPERDANIDPDPYFLALEGPNQWPSENLLPEFRKTVEAFYSEMSLLAQSLLEVMSLSLGLSQNFMEDMFGGRPSPYLKVIRYPATDLTRQGVGTHKDSGYLTLLLQDEVGGLQAQNVNGEWYDIPPLKDSLIVNVGELMQLVSHNYFFAAPHRVRNNPHHERFSSAFFYSPDLRTRLEMLPMPASLIQQAKHSQVHRNAGMMASKSELDQGLDGMGSHAIPKVFGEKYWQRWVRSYPEIAEKYYPQN